MSSSDSHSRIHGDRDAFLAATPNGTVDICGIQHHITPESQQEDSESGPKEPDTPCKELMHKKNPPVAKPGSKRKLFLQSDKKQGTSGPAVSRQKKSLLSSGSFPIVSGSVSHFPLTERQQLQYLLEVTARQAKSEENCNDTETANYTKIKRKETGKENNTNLRLHKRNDRGETALHVAAIKGDLDDVKALIMAGANVNGKDYAGWTPLHEACNHGHLQIAKELVAAGANVNASGLDEFTPLHDAVINDHIQIIEFLFQHGADTQLRTRSGHQAADLSRSSVVTRLLTGLTLEQAPCNPSPAPNMTGLTDQSEVTRMAANWALQPAPHVQSPAPTPKGQALSTNQSEDATMPADWILESAPCCQSLAQKITGQTADCTPVSPEPHDLSVLPALLTRGQTPGNESAVLHKDKNDKKEETTRLEHECKIKKSVNNEEEFTEEYVSISKLNECLTNAAAEMSSYLECKEVLFLDSDQENDFKNSSTSAPSLCLAQNSKKVLSPVTERTTPLPDKNAMAPTNLTCVNDFTEAGIVSHQLTKHDENLIPSGFNEYAHANSYESILSLKKPTVSDGTTANKPFNRHETDSPKPRTVSPRKKRKSTMGRMNASSAQNGSSSSHNSSLQTSSTDSVVSSFMNCPSTLSPAPAKIEQVCGKLCKTTPTSCSSYNKASTFYTNNSHTKTPDTQASQVKTPTICANHIKTPTWRRAIAKHRYQISSLPVHVPSYEKFTMHTKAYLLHEQSREDDNLTSKSSLEEIRLSHQVEKDKLKLCVEQELVRVFTNFARDVVDKPVPYSVCFVLKAQAIGSTFEDPDCTLCGSEVGSSLRTDVAKILNKFERIKQEMLSRQRLEYEAVLALQQMYPDSQAEAPPRGCYMEDFDLVPFGFREQFQRLMFQNCLV